MVRIDRETAKDFFHTWLDFKKVRARKRENAIENEQMILDAIEDGDVSFDDNNNLIYKLLCPLLDDKGGVALESLTFKPRITVSEIEVKSKGLAANDAEGKVLAYIAAATNLNTGLIKKFDSADYTFCQSIVVYFL